MDAERAGGGHQGQRLGHDGATHAARLDYAARHESQSVVAAGEPLLVIGNPASLEVVVEVLSTDAVRIEPGMEVRFQRWGGDYWLPRPSARDRRHYRAVFALARPRRRLTRRGGIHALVGLGCSATVSPRGTLDVQIFAGIEAGAYVVLPP